MILSVLANLHLAILFNIDRPLDLTIPTHCRSTACPAPFNKSTLISLDNSCISFKKAALAKIDAAAIATCTLSPFGIKTTFCSTSLIFLK